MSYINTYQPAEYYASFDLPDGEYKACILSATPTQNNGNNYIDVVLSFNETRTPGHYRSMREGDYFDSTATKFFDTFAIPRGNFDMKQWRGCVGNVKISHTPAKDSDKVYCNIDLLPPPPAEEPITPLRPQQKPLSEEVMF